MVKNPPTNAGDTRDLKDTDLILGLGRFLRVGNGTPLHYSCLRKPMDRGAWQTIYHMGKKSWTQLSTNYYIRSSKSSESPKFIYKIKSLLRKQNESHMKTFKVKL